MRLVTLDTETTGMHRGRGVSVSKGHRVIEIACVEIVNLKIERSFHRYINPGGVAIQPGAVKVHGITSEYLADKPAFHEVVDDLLDFIGDSVIIIHNASFDTAFLDKEFALLKGNNRLNGRIFPVIDTLALARERFPRMPNSLDSLCRRFGIGCQGRNHSALVDATLLARLFILIS